MAFAKALLFEHLLPQFRSTPLLRPVMRILCNDCSLMLSVSFLPSFSPPSTCSSIFCGPIAALPILPFAKRRDVVAGDGAAGEAWPQPRVRCAHLRKSVGSVPAVDAQLCSP